MTWQDWERERLKLEAEGQAERSVVAEGSQEG